MSDPASRLKEARLRSGKTVAEIAALAGINAPSYYDLEAQRDELMSVISLGDLANLARALGIDGASLFSDQPVIPISLTALSNRIKTYLAEKRLGIAEFSKHVGYDIEDILKSPNAALDWNIDCLRSVCSQIGIDWISAIPNRQRREE
jgi:transcriptional regulator with XRE-family HTH domain